MFYSIALVITLLSEAGGMLLYTTLIHRVLVDRRSILVVVLGVNLITHPIFWFTFTAIPMAFVEKLYLAEFVVAVVEGLVYRQCCRFSWREAIGLGLALNLLSAAIGLTVWNLLPM